MVQELQDSRRYPAARSQGVVHLTFIEKPLFSFLALFAARFSIKVFCGFFLSCFLASLPLLMFVAPYDWF